MATLDQPADYMLANDPYTIRFLAVERARQRERASALRWAVACDRALQIGKRELNRELLAMQCRYDAQVIRAAVDFSRQGLLGRSNY